MPSDLLVPLAYCHISLVPLLLVLILSLLALVLPLSALVLQAEVDSSIRFIPSNCLFSPETVQTSITFIRPYRHILYTVPASVQLIPRTYDLLLYSSLSCIYAPHSNL